MKKKLENSDFELLELKSEKNQIVNTKFSKNSSLLSVQEVFYKLLYMLPSDS